MLHHIPQMLWLFTDHETVIWGVNKVVRDIAPVLMPMYMRPRSSGFYYVHPVQIVAVRSALKHTSNVTTLLQLGEVGNLMQHSIYQSDTMALLLTTTIDIQKPQIYAKKACNSNNTTLVQRLLWSSTGFGSIPSVGGLVFVPGGIWWNDDVEMLVGACCQVEHLPAIVDEEFWFDDLKVPQYIPLQLCMAHIPVQCYLYGMVSIFIGEVKAGWTHIHKLFLFPRSLLVGIFNCWCHHCIYLIICGNPMMIGVSKLNDCIYQYWRVLGNIWAYRVWKVWQNHLVICFKSYSKASRPNLFGDGTPGTLLM